MRWSRAVPLGRKDTDGHLFWDCTFLPYSSERELPEFMPLVARDQSRWPRCLLLAWLVAWSQ